MKELADGKVPIRKTEKMHKMHFRYLKNEKEINMKKNMLLVLVLAVICAVFTSSFAIEEAATGNFEPKIQPAEMNASSFGYAFE